MSKPDWKDAPELQRSVAKGLVLGVIDAMQKKGYELVFSSELQSLREAAEQVDLCGCHTKKSLAAIKQGASS